MYCCHLVSELKCNSVKNIPNIGLHLFFWEKHCPFCWSQKQLLGRIQPPLGIMTDFQRWNTKKYSAPNCKRSITFPQMFYTLRNKNTDSGTLRTIVVLIGQGWLLYMITVEEINSISFSGFPKEMFPVTNLTNCALGYSSAAMLLLRICKQYKIELVKFKQDIKNVCVWLLHSNYMAFTATPGLTRQ